MQLRRIRQFLAVADQGHFGRAAEVAGVSQPTLSEQVRKLEDELGAVLLRRTPRGAELTEAGAAFAAHVRPAVVTIEDAVAAVGSRAAARPLRVAYVDTIIHAFGRRLVRLTAAEAQPSLTLREVPPHVQDRDIAAGELDAGLAYGPRRTPGLVVETVAREDVVVALPATHRLSAAAQVELAELAGDRFVVVARALDPGVHDAHIARLRAAGLPMRRLRDAESKHAVLAMVAAGAGVATLPRSVRRLRPEGVVLRPIAGAPLRADIVLSSRMGRRDPAVAALLAQLGARRPAS